MTKSFRPLKAPSKGIPDEHISKLRYPLMASPKLDGLRVLHYNGQAVSSSLNPVKNRHTHKLCSVEALSWMDGEMAVGDGMDADGFKQAVSAVMAENGEYPITWWVFDICHPDYIDRPFRERFHLLKELVASAELPYVQVVPHKVIVNLQELLEYEIEMLHQGFEGVMLRDPNGRYKYDRSTLNEGILLKLKRGHEVRGDAKIVGFKERMRNDNEMVTNLRGLSERSSHKENLVPRGDLGSFTVVDSETGAEFSIGAGDGLDDNLRKQVWDNKDSYLGRIIRYQWFAYGGYDKPRFPKFIEFRHEEDITV